MTKIINTFKDLEKECEISGKKIFEVTQEYEAELAETSIDTIRSVVKKSLDAMKEAIQTGLKSKELSISGMCGDDCDRLQKRFSDERALFGQTFEKITTYALATIEENLRMGKIAACPTAGSCAIVPSVLVGVSEDLNISEEEQINALITAGTVGRIISTKVALAGAVAGCQAECGVASAMSAAALTQLRGGSVNQILNAVALAMKNLLGLTCDPVSYTHLDVYKRQEIICVNDGSTDDSLKVLQEFKASDNRIVIIDKANEGSGVARNTALAIAKGEYVYFVDSDDWLDNAGVLEKLYAKANADVLDILIFGGL